MTVSTSPSKHTVHSPFLLLSGSGGENMGDTGGLSGELGAVTAERENRTDLNNVVLRCALVGQPREDSTYGGTVGDNPGRHRFRIFFWALPLFLSSYPNYQAPFSPCGMPCLDVSPPSSRKRS